MGAKGRVGFGGNSQFPWQPGHSVDESVEPGTWAITTFGWWKIKEQLCLGYKQFIIMLWKKVFLNSTHWCLK